MPHTLLGFGNRAVDGMAYLWSLVLRVSKGETFKKYILTQNYICTVIKYPIREKKYKIFLEAVIEKSKWKYAPRPHSFDLNIFLIKFFLFKSLSSEKVTFVNYF